MGETCIVNGQVYIGRRFEEKTLCLSGGTLRVLEPDATVVEDAFTISEHDVENAASKVADWLSGLEYGGVP